MLFRGDFFYKKLKIQNIENVFHSIDFGDENWTFDFGSELLLRVFFSDFVFDYFYVEFFYGNAISKGMNFLFWEITFFHYNFFISKYVGFFISA